MLGAEIDNAYQRLVLFMRYALVMRIVVAITIGVVTAMALTPWIGVAYAALAIALVMSEIRIYKRHAQNSHIASSRRLMLISTGLACFVFNAPALAMINSGTTGLFIGTLFATTSMVVHTIFYGNHRMIGSFALGPLAMLTLGCFISVFLQARLDQPLMAFLILGAIPAYTVTILALQTMLAHHEKRLRLMTEHAEAANVAKGEFLANMSHEIRTPMNGIIAMADMLQASGLDVSQKQYADIITSSGENLLVIINDILDFSKLEANQMDLHPSPFELVQLVEEVAELIAVNASDAVDVASFVDPVLPKQLIGDSVRIRQVLLNMAGNAAKFTESGSILISVTLGDGVEGGAVPLRFRIHDSGIGIEADRLDHMFDAFTQATSGTTKLYGGTGLGLSICKDLVSLMDGTVFAQSVVGEGSTFGFDIALPSEAGTATAPMTSDLHGQSIAILSRSYAMYWSLQAQLTRRGATVLPQAAPSVTMGNVVSGAQLCTCLIVDCRLKNADGVKLAEWLQQHADKLAPSLVILGEDGLSVPVRSTALTERLSKSGTVPSQRVA